MTTPTEARLKKAERLLADAGALLASTVFTGGIFNPGQKSARRKILKAVAKLLGSNP